MVLRKVDWDVGEEISHGVLGWYQAIVSKQDAHYHWMVGVRGPVFSSGIAFSMAEGMERVQKAIEYDIMGCFEEDV